MTTLTFEINGELKDILGLLMIEWIELNYQEAKEIQQNKFETYPPYKDEFKEPCDFYLDLMQILFVSFSYNEKLVDFIIKKETIKWQFFNTLLDFIKQNIMFGCVGLETV